MKMYGVLQGGEGGGGQNRAFFAYVIYGWPFICLNFEVFLTSANDGAQFACEMPEYNELQ